MVIDKVLIEWRTNDKWKGVQQEIKRKDINPDGPLDIGQNDAVAAESWKPKNIGMSLLFFSSPFVGICGLSKFSKTRLWIELIGNIYISIIIVYI